MGIFAFVWVMSLFHHCLDRLLGLDRSTALSMAFWRVLCRLQAISRVEVVVSPASTGVFIFFITSSNFSQSVSLNTLRGVNLGVLKWRVVVMSAWSESPLPSWRADQLPVIAVIWPLLKVRFRIV